MKTWKMIKELTKDPDKVFKNQNGEKIRLLPDDDLLFEGEGGYDYISITDEWEEVKESVSFTDVLEKVESNRLTPISFYHDKSGVEMYYSTLEYILHRIVVSFSGSNIARIIQDGQWYIED